MFRVSLLAVLMALPMFANAQGFDYDFFELTYGTVDLDDADVDGDGFGINGSFAIADNFYAFGGYRATDFDFNIDGTNFNLGLGYNRALSDVLDIVAGLSYEYVELDSAFGSVDDNGFGLGVGLRFAATPELELNAGINYVDLSDSGSDTSLNFRGLYNFTPAIALAVGAGFSDDATSFSIGGRFYFNEF